MHQQNYEKSIHSRIPAVYSIWYVYESEAYAPPPVISAHGRIFKRLEHVRYMPHRSRQLHDLYLNDELVYQMGYVYNSELVTQQWLIERKASLALFVDRIIKDGSDIPRKKETKKWIEQVIFNHGDDLRKEEEDWLTSQLASSRVQSKFDSRRYHYTRELPSDRFRVLSELEIVGSIAMGLDVRSSDVDASLKMFKDERERLKMSEYKVREMTKDRLHEIGFLIESVPVLKPIHQIKRHSSAIFQPELVDREIREYAAAVTENVKILENEEKIDCKFEVRTDMDDTKSEMIGKHFPSARIEEEARCRLRRKRMESERFEMDSEYLYCGDYNDFFGHIAMETDTHNTYSLKVWVYSTAKVPIIKIEDPFLQVTLDISTVDNVRSVGFIRDLVHSGIAHGYKLSDNRVPVFVATIKHWVRCRRINSSFDRYMNSFGFVMLCLKYLQMLVPRIIDVRVPLFETVLLDEGVSGSNQSSPIFREYVGSELIMPSESTMNRMRLSELIFGFFEWALKLDRRHFSVDLTAIGFGFKANSSISEHKQAELLIIDPIDSSNNVARNMAPDQACKIWKEFERAYQMLRSGANWYDVCEIRRSERHMSETHRRRATAVVSHRWPYY